jgi:TPR repeat protein
LFTAFNDDPYSPKVVEGRQNARNTGNTQTPSEAGVRQNQKYAQTWLDKAASQGHKMALKVLESL